MDIINKNFSVIGKPTGARVDGAEKVSGEYKYAGDFYIPGMLYAKVLRSPHAHALVKKIDKSQAEKLPGVIAVITHEDAPKDFTYRGTPSLPSATTRDSHILEKRAKHVGDRIAAVAAESPEIAEEALRLIRVEYEVLPAVFDDIEAMQPGAPSVHQTIRKGYKESFEIKNNTLGTVVFEFGNIKEGFKEADHIIESEINVGAPTNGQLERSVCICQPKSGGRYDIWATAQSVHALRQNLYWSFDIPRGKINVHRLYLGGAFGSHIHTSWLPPICMALSMKTKRPVRIDESREEMFYSMGRHPAIFRLKTGVKNDGILTAMEMQAIDHTGSYAVLAKGIMILEIGFFCSMYQCKNIRAEGSTVYTHTPPRTAMRGAGNPQQTFAVETHIEHVAEKIGMDPIEFRLKSQIGLGDRFYGQGPDVVCIIQSCAIEKIIEEGKKRFDWENRKAQIPYPDKPWIKRGIGMARGFHTSGAGGVEPSENILDYSGAMVIVHDDGYAVLLHGSVDCGGGTTTAHAKIVAEELGIGYEDILVKHTDTDGTPYDTGTHASRGTYCMGLAVREAAAKAKKQIFEWASRMLHLPTDQLVIRDRRIFLSTNPEIGIELEEVLKEAVMKDWGTAMGTASLRAPACPPHFIANFVEVDVDTETGKVRVVKAFAGADVGTPLYHEGVRGQLIGGMHMGLGYALTENTTIDSKTGEILNAGYRDYKMIPPLEMPEVDVFIANDSCEPTGPFGAKGAGEGCTNAVAPAVANAIYNAIGVRINDIPITPEKILKALKKCDIKENG